MFKIKFYEDKNGYSELHEQLNQLAEKSKKDKNSRILYQGIQLMIDALSKYGTYLPFKMTKHLKADIWELRPGRNRILYFYFKDNTYVLLHMFLKKTEKTPIREIERAEREISEYIKRNGEN